MELAMSCDFIVATKRSKFGLVECRLGIIPGAGGTQRLPKLINPSKAKEIIMFAKIIDA